MEQVVDVTGVVLAGGKSRRMGEDKRFLTVGGATLLERSLAVMTQIFPEVLVVTAQDSSLLEAEGCRVCHDLVPDCGSLGGLYTGLALAAESRIFVVACDMPFLNQDMIRWFLKRDDRADVVMGRLPTGLQPLHAVYGKRALPIFERMVKERRLKIQDVISEPALKITLVEPSEWADIDPLSRSFQNVNTPADLETARTAVSRSTLSE
jgi:molybdopterin-guanine dinucleotide biosynthesis protein A